MNSVLETQALPRVARQTASTRLVSIDALRGFDMFWIMGGDYLVRSLPSIHDSAFTRALAAQMEHYEWAGFHFYDLIFPLFVFIVGVSLVFSVSRMIERDGRPAAIKRIVIRSVILFLLGMFYMGGVANGFKNVYFAGVLPRIAVAYFFAALIFCFFKTRTMAAISIALLLGYWALMTFVPVPGIGAADLSGPGKNLAHYIDQLYMPGKKFEGTILSTMAAVANCLLGVFAGLLLKNETISAQKKVYWLIGSGLAGLALGFGFAHQFPIIKLLWTSTYVLVSCGYGALLLGVFFQIIEIWNWQNWAQPFVWMGMNAITIYIVANIVNFHRVAARFVGGDIKIFLGNWSGMVQALVTIALGFWLVHFLYCRKIFLRL
jgi:predicted acyltransferase